MNDKLPIFTPQMQRLFRAHGRAWRDYQYVYPVVSRRSHGLSIGVNLNIDKACNFDCLYCCVDRTPKAPPKVPSALPGAPGAPGAPPQKNVDLDQLQTELDHMLAYCHAGSIWAQPEFQGTQPDYQRINDIAFSGDGEPTAYPHFDRACQIAVQLKNKHQLPNLKIIVITNATLLDRPMVQRAFELLDNHNGQIWAKLDAGTQTYYKFIDRTTVPLTKVLANIRQCGRTRPIVIQSLFMAINGTPTPTHEFDAYIDRLRDLLHDDCQIDHVQLYTIARRTAESHVTPLDPPTLDAMANRLRDALPALDVHVYHGVP